MNDTLPAYTLTRQASSNHGTMGEMFNPDGSHLCYTCELPWLNDQADASCIPLGTYTCGPHNSPAHPDVWEIQNVPGRSGILIHNANFWFQLLGCIGVGQSFGPLEYSGSEYPQYTGQTYQAILNSQNTLEMLRNTLPDNFTLTINGPAPH
jgi:hypothetical protein